MTNKNHLTLYIDNELINIAKSINMNLSQEFEEWIRIRLNQNIEDKPIIDIELERAKLKAQLIQLDNIQEQDKLKIDKQKEEIMIIDNMIDNMIEYKEDLTNITDTRLQGLKFLYKKKFNKDINILEAKELLINRIKEKGLINA